MTDFLNNKNISLLSMTSKSLTQLQTPHYYLEIALHSLSSSTAQPSKHLRFAVFRNIQKLDQAEVISMSIKQNTSLKNKLLDPLIFKVTGDNRKPMEYSIVLYEVSYPVNEEDHLVQEEIGSLKMPVDKFIQLFKEKGQDHKVEQTKDKLNGDIELTYLITVHSDSDRYNQLIKRKVFKDAVPDEELKLKKVESQKPPLADVTNQKEDQTLQANRIIFSETKPKKDASQNQKNQMAQEEAEQQQQTVAAPLLLETASDNIKLEEKLMEEPVEQLPPQVPSSPKPEKFQNLPVINQQQQITDKFQKVKRTLIKIPTYKYVAILVGFLVLVSLSYIETQKRPRAKTTKSKRGL